MLAVDWAIPENVEIAADVVPVMGSQRWFSMTNPFGSYLQMAN